jgi:tetratricopeptide (TPR) repeat protein
MKLIRWLLSNIILIAFILALTYAYVYWDNLTGPDTPAGKVVAVLTEEFESVREFVESYQPDVDDADRGVAATSETITADPDMAAPASSGVEPVASPQTPSQPTQTQQPPQLTSTTAVNKTVISADKGVAGRQLWIAARTAFQKGQYEESIGLYRDIVAANSDSFDAWGEMGNVYVRLGDTEQAANAYYEAAVIMVRLGQPARARSVLPLLHRLDRNKARQLNNLIMNPSSRVGV